MDNNDIVILPVSSKTGHDSIVGRELDENKNLRREIKKKREEKDQLVKERDQLAKEVNMSFFDWLISHRLKSTKPRNTSGYSPV